MQSKYKAIKTTINGITFDSKLESKRYLELLMMEKSGRIEKLELQPSFLLQPSFKKNGKTYRKIEYVADFKYYDPKKGKWVIEDTKGFETDSFKIKKKMFEYKYKDLELEIVKK